MPLNRKDNMSEKNWRRAEQSYLERGYWRPWTLAEELAFWAEQYRDDTAIVAGEQRISYQQLHIQADEIASGLYGLGLRPGDRVLLQLPNSIEFALALFACFRLGLLPILLTPTHRENEILSLTKLAEPVAYFCASTYLATDYRELTRTVMDKCPSLRFCISNDGVLPGSLALQSLRQPVPENLPGPHYSDTAVLLLSGGTTGTPKLIPRSHSDYCYNARASAARCGLNRDSVYLAVLPVSHNFPLSCPGLLGTLWAGGRVVMAKSAGFDEAFALIEQERVSITALVPALLNFWLDAREWDESDLSSLRCLQVGGAPLDPAVAMRVEPTLGCRLQQVFGTAEGLVCYTNLDDPQETVLTTQGRPLSDADEIRFVDEQGHDVPPGQEGEMIVRGPYTIEGYYRAEEVNLRSFTVDGYYRTGDMARLTADGCVQIRGRIKDQVNRAGEKIAAVEIEDHLRAHPGVRDAALVGVPDAHLGERSCAWIIPGDEAMDLAALREFLRARGLAEYKLPDQLKTIAAWPMTNVGKVNKRELVQRAAL